MRLYSRVVPPHLPGAPVRASSPRNLIRLARWGRDSSVYVRVCRRWRELSRVGLHGHYADSDDGEQQRRDQRQELTRHRAATCAADRANRLAGGVQMSCLSSPLRGSGDAALGRLPRRRPRACGPVPPHQGRVERHRRRGVAAECDTIEDRRNGGGWRPPTYGFGYLFRGGQECWRSPVTRSPGRCHAIRVSASGRSPSTRRSWAAGHCWPRFASA